MIPVGQEFLPYSQEVASKLLYAGFGEVDERDEVGYKMVVPN